MIFLDSATRKKRKTCDGVKRPGENWKKMARSQENKDFYATQLLVFLQTVGVVFPKP